MKPIPARMLRACIAHLNLPSLTKRDLAQMEHILPASIALFARQGICDFNVRRVALEIGVSPTTLQRLYCDVEHLLGEILRGHLAKLIAALNGIAENAPNRPAQCRAAYHRLIRCADGKLTDEHALLVRYSHHLPPDELEPTEARRCELNALLGAGWLGSQAASLLDGGLLPLDRIEKVLAVLAQNAGPFETAATPPPPAANQNQRAPAWPPWRAAPDDRGASPADPGPGIVRPPGTALH